MVHKGKMREKIIIQPKKPLDDTLMNLELDQEDQEDDDSSAYRVIDRLEVEKNYLFFF